MKTPFTYRHIGSNKPQQDALLKTLGLESINKLIDETIPANIRSKVPLEWSADLDEHELLDFLRSVAKKNKIFHSYIGQGYYDTVVPGVILRNILENPGWYTQYTPYQAEISQGRLEALLNFQTMVMDLTAMDIANASLLDEATAAAEAMIMLYRSQRKATRTKFFVATDVFEQTLAVLRTRANPLDIEIVVGDPFNAKLDESYFGILVQYPTATGAIHDYSELCINVHNRGAHVVVAADIMSLVLLTPPGEFGADVVVGNTQRFGVPMGYGGPHAAYFATNEEFKRKVPGRIIGVSVDRHGNRALRMALQTREQHIRREKATSNICTAQVLLAIMAGMYAVYHGPDNLKAIAKSIHKYTQALASGLQQAGHRIINANYFDTLHVQLNGISLTDLKTNAINNEINFQYYNDGTIGIALGETINLGQLQRILDVFKIEISAKELFDKASEEIDSEFARTSTFLDHPVFNSFQTETEMMRYIRRLESKDLSLNTSMIPLGSCTMKLNSVAEMEPVTWPEFANIHPFVPVDQAEGYKIVIDQLGQWLCEITGLPAVSMQPNSGAQGEYTGLMVIREYHLSKNNKQRNVCLIPASAHGTNPASAIMAGMNVVIVKCDDNGNIDLTDLEEKASTHKDKLAAFMVTYPSTHGVFEEGIIRACEIVHENGGFVYMDGANLNAMVGLCQPGDFGADVIHINLHKTFSIPHGGGGPGMGPICVSSEMEPFLPGHPMVNVDKEKTVNTVSAAPWGSANILLISWVYMALMGGEGLTHASEIAILNANYMAKRLEDYYPILYTGKYGRVAHEFIIDLRPFKLTTGITEEDVAKRLMDYGFHAPTMSFPVPGTLMIEPTESESRIELDRLCDALIEIHKEILAIEKGVYDRVDNALKNAPHTAAYVSSDNWEHSYSRETAAYPVDGLKEFKFWPAVGRVDNAFGDRNLICSCPPIEDYE